MEPSYMIIEVRAFHDLYNLTKGFDKQGFNVVYSPAGLVEPDQLEFIKDHKDEKPPNLNHDLEGVAYKAFHVKNMLLTMQAAQKGSLPANDFLEFPDRQPPLLKLGDLLVQESLKAQLSRVLLPVSVKTLFHVEPTGIHRQVRNQILESFDQLCRYPSGQALAQDIWYKNIGSIEPPGYLYRHKPVSKYDRPEFFKEVLAKHTVRQLASARSPRKRP